MNPRQCCWLWRGSSSVRFCLFFEPFFALFCLPVDPSALPLRLLSFSLLPPLPLRPVLRRTDFFWRIGLPWNCPLPVSLITPHLLRVAASIRFRAGFRFRPSSPSPLQVALMHGTPPCPIPETPRFRVMGLCPRPRQRTHSSVAPMTSFSLSLQLQFPPRGYRRVGQDRFWKRKRFTAHGNRPLPPFRSCSEKPFFLFLPGFFLSEMFFPMPLLFISLGSFRLHPLS